MEMATTQLIILMLVFIVIFSFGVVFIINKHDKNILSNTSDMSYVDYAPLSFDQCEEILSVIITDVYNNKYYLHYKLKEIVVIPKMDNEIVEITKEILDGMSPHLKKSFSLYYTEEYLISMITRRIQVLLVQYTNENKPVTK